MIYEGSVNQVYNENSKNDIEKMLLRKDHNEMALEHWTKKQDKEQIKFWSKSLKHINSLIFKFRG